MKRATDNRPLRSLFHVLTLLIIAAYLGLVVHLWYQNLADFRSSLAYINSTVVQGVRTTLKGHELVLRELGRVLIRLGSLKDPELGRDLIERARLIDPGMAGFGLARVDGQLVLVSGIEPGEPLPNLALGPETRDSFSETLASSHLRTGRPYYFDALGHWVVPIRVAIRGDDGKTLAVMTAGYTIADATTTWTNLTLPPRVSVGLIRDDGYMLFSQPLPDGPLDRALQTVYGRPLAQNVPNDGATIDNTSTFGVPILSGTAGASYTAYTYIPEYGLHARTYIDRSAVIENWLQRLLAPSMLLLLFLAGSTLAYRHANQRQTASDTEVRRLTAWQQAMLDCAAYSIVSTDTNGVIATFNRAAQRMLGYGSQEVIGKQTPAIIHDRQEVVQRAAELSLELGRTVPPGFEAFIAGAREGQIDEREWTYIRKDGSRFPVLLSVTAMTEADGDIIGFLGIADDLSEQKAMRANLRDSEARYRALFENAGDAILLIREGRFVDCNPATLEMFNRPREEIVGASPDDFAAERQPDGQVSAAKARQKLNAAFLGEPQFFEWQHLRRDGSLFDVEITLNALEIAGRPHIQATVRDISERKCSEAELAHSRLALVERNDNLRLLNELSQRLHGTLSLDDILHETTQALVGLIQTPYMGIYLLDNSKTQLFVAHIHNYDDSLLELAYSVPYAGSLSEAALTRGAPQICPNITEDSHIHPDNQAALRAVGAKSGIIIPLICQGEPMGSIVLVLKEDQKFTEISQETLLSLSNTVALAITNARHMDHLEFQARHDGLTGLPNRALLHETFLKQRSAAGSDRLQATLLLLDLDKFKDVNDTLGHHIGDQILTQIGPRLELACLGHQTLISRLGGDEFAILLSKSQDTCPDDKVARAIVDSMRQPFLVEGVELHVGVSIGVACCPEHGEDSHSLLRAADVAMYQAKKLSTGIVIYDNSFDDYSTERLALANELAQAVKHDQLVLHYQPKIDINQGNPVAFEALVRWRHPRLGLLYPGDFIELVELSKIIHSFTRAVIQIATADKRRLKDLGYDQPVAINLSANNLIDTSCFSNLMEAIIANDLPPGEVELELTETALMHDQKKAAALLRQFSEVGVNITIDDFGTGYSSLSYLRQLPIRAMKIDRSFVTDMLTERQDSTIVRSTIALAHNLSLDVIAEGVENNETLSMLRAMGCDQAQGFGLCRPLPIDQLIDWLTVQHQSEPAPKGG
ncbi:MAG: EAL domain-containing protein [Gammaproteobacteria bacterium]|nr:EAL domain-containing protein [Gammaproteobacteria bacterium]